ncbi:hypothetical protein [Endozoicomonas sp. OPT23]|uniref:hypothetical protein n=1 Tax=Endozoicomonas sp. OPT23 TaxID=2072845 RepID=UPI00129C00EF|nr:hypothetical protein [Endozoicomonas sp. OPT23]
MIKIILLPGWLQNGTPDPDHPHQRRFTKRYRFKRKQLKPLWIIACLLMLINPAVHLIMLIALPMSLLSFIILDETE